jgi:predicted dehydrogenase
MTIRVGVIGGGIWGNYHLLAARQMEGEQQVELVAVATRTQATADRQATAFGIRAYTNYQQMLADEALDAVTIATPDHLHREMTLDALEAGCHVLVEKPMDLSTVGAREMVEQADRTGLLLQVDFHKRYDPFNIDARGKVQDGQLGDLYYAYAYMEDKIVVPTEWLASWAANSSPFWFIGVHKYDLLRWLTRQEAVSVSARGYRGKLAGMGIDTYDAVSATIEMNGGLTCQIDVNWVLPTGFEAVVNQGFRLVGSEGIIETDAQDRGLRHTLAPGSTATPNPTAILIQETPYGWKDVQGYFVEPIKDFLRNVQFLSAGGSLAALDGTYPSGNDGLRVTQLAEAAHRSIEQGQAVAVDDIA